MRNFVIRVLISAIAIAITASLLPGIQLGDDSLGTLLILGVIFGLVNAFVKPLLIFLTCPAVILSLGLFILVINGLMLQLAAWFAGDRLDVDGLGTAVLGGIIMAIVTMVLEGVLGVDDDNNRERPERNIPKNKF